MLGAFATRVAASEKHLLCLKTGGSLDQDIKSEQNHMEVGADRV